ncbi:hypothetical protein [Emticicia sp. 17c]|uniref:hypothetical protein n=1 Tax=Emticicia sp. 17c TaxID=3127704 RepID=UPI00301C9D25
MRKLILVGSLIGGLVMGAYAQDAKQTRGDWKGKTPEQRAEMRTKHMQESLALTNEQYQKILAINLEQEKKRELQHKENQEKMAAARQEMRANHEALIKNYENVLTPEQMTKFKDESKKRRAEMRDKMKGRRRR